MIFLDEPTSGVDPLSRRRFWDLIYDLSGKGVTVFVTTHYMEEAEYCDRIGLIHRGDLVAVGTPRQLKTSLTQDHVIDVRCERPQDAMLALEDVEGVKDVALFGNALHVVAPDAAVAMRNVAKRLRAEGYRVERIEPITASLEDVFVSLVEARDRAQPSRAEFGA